MPNFVMMVGLPGSGKSTWVRKNIAFNSYDIISFDKIIEEMMFKDNISYSESFEKYKKKATQKIYTDIMTAIDLERDIIVDMTNLSVNSRRSKLSKIPDTYTKTAYYLSISPWRAFERQVHAVPEKIFNRMNFNLEIPTMEEGFDVVGTIEVDLIEKRKCYIFDIDGTLADCSHRLHHIQGKKKDYDSFYKGIKYDKPIKSIIELFTQLEYVSGQSNISEQYIFIVTGRSDRYRGETNLWLERYNIFSDYTFMRPEGDHSTDTIIKKKYLDMLKRNGYEIILAVEDRKRVVDMYRENGVTCLAIQDKDY